MTLVDTSAWIEFLRPHGEKSFKERIAVLIDTDSSAYTCPIYFELLLGARPHEESNVNDVLTHSRRFYFANRHWALAVKLGRQLRKSGVTVPSNDLFVAAVAISERLQILHKDEHFPLMKKVLGNELRLEVMI